MKTRSSLLFLAAALASGCAASTHPVVAADLGRPSGADALWAVIDEPGPIEVETVASADWAVPLSGLVNLDDPAAAGLEDRDEPIQIFFHALRHPTRGTFLVDTGVERAVRDAPDEAVLRGLVASAMNVDAMVVHAALGDWLSLQRGPGRPVDGVLLTHLHADHILGLPDLPRGTPIYVGPGETTPRAFLNLFSQGVVDEALEGHQALREWGFQADPSGAFDGVLDVFGDGSLWALWVPGHTPGSTAYLARTPQGPVLMVGDACHTAWGWSHGVEPGTFSADQPTSRRSLDRLRALVAAHPSVQVRLGHQHPSPAVAVR